MSQPPKYIKIASFSQLGTVNPVALDVELVNIANSANASATNLGLIQRDDGALKDGLVTIAALSNPALVMLAGAANQAVVSSAQTAQTAAASSATSATASANIAVASVTSFGAVGDAITNDSAALVASASVQDAKLSPSVYLANFQSLLTAKLSRFFGNGKLRVIEKIGSPLMTDLSGFDMTGVGQSIGGAAHIAMLDDGPIGDIAKLQAGLVAGTCNITFVGDSLTENNGNQIQSPASWVRGVMRMFDDSFSGIAFNYTNLGLNGCQSAQAVDPAFVVGTAPYFTNRVKPLNFPVALGWWPNGATINESIISCTASGGTGYVQGQAINFSAPSLGGTQAKGFANVTAGALTSVTMTNLGSGYVGLTPTATTATGTGAAFTLTLGSKAWRDYVRDSEPDLLVIALGQNDMGPAPDGFQTNIQAYIDYTKTWTKIPSIVLVSTFQPNRLNATYAGYQNVIEAACRAMGALAQKNKCLYANTYRMFKFIRDGVDDTYHQFVNEANTRNFQTWWAARIGAMPIGASTITSTDNFQVFRNTVLARDVIFNTTVTLTHIAQIPQIFYRNRITNTGGITGGTSGYTVMLVYGAGNWYLQLWKSGVQIGTTFNLGAIALNTPINISIEAINHRHRIYYNGTLVKDVSDYATLESGELGFGMTGTAPAGTTATWVTQLQIGIPRVLGRPSLVNDGVIYGDALATDPIAGWNAISQDHLTGGNALNHITYYAHAVMYMAAWGSVMRRIKSNFTARM